MHTPFVALADELLKSHEDVERLSARTLEIVGKLRDGDVIVVRRHQDVEDYRRAMEQLDKLDVEVDIIIIDPVNIGNRLPYIADVDRVWIDHRWLYQYTVNQVRNIDSNFADYMRYMFSRTTEVNFVDADKAFEIRSNIARTAGKVRAKRQKKE